MGHSVNTFLLQKPDQHKISKTGPKFYNSCQLFAILKTSLFFLIFVALHNGEVRVNSTHLSVYLPRDIKAQQCSDEWQVVSCQTPRPMLATQPVNVRHSPAERQNLESCDSQHLVLVFRSQEHTERWLRTTLERLRSQEHTERRLRTTLEWLRSQEHTERRLRTTLEWLITAPK